MKEDESFWDDSLIAPLPRNAGHAYTRNMEMGWPFFSPQLISCRPIICSTNEPNKHDKHWTYVAVSMVLVSGRLYA